MTGDYLTNVRSKTIDKLGPLHPVCQRLHPGRAASARIDLVPPCPNCLLRHESPHCHLLSIEDYALMRKE